MSPPQKLLLQFSFLHFQGVFDSATVLIWCYCWPKEIEFIRSSVVHVITPFQSQILQWTATLLGFYRNVVVNLERQLDHRQRVLQIISLSCNHPKQAFGRNHPRLIVVITWSGGLDFEWSGACGCPRFSHDAYQSEYQFFPRLPYQPLGPPDNVSHMKRTKQFRFNIECTRVGEHSQSSELLGSREESNDYYLNYQPSFHRFSIKLKHHAACSLLIAMVTETNPFDLTWLRSTTAEGCRTGNTVLLSILNAQIKTSMLFLINCKEVILGYQTRGIPYSLIWCYYCEILSWKFPRKSRSSQWTNPFVICKKY